MQSQVAIDVVAWAIAKKKLPTDGNSLVSSQSAGSSQKKASHMRRKSPSHPTAAIVR